MPRFKIDKNQIKNDTVILSGDDVKHISRVLRHGIGDELILFDGYGTEYTSRIEKSGKSEIEATIVSRQMVNRESPIQITLLQSITKGEKMDMIIQKATELGVNHIVPIVCEHSDVRNTKKISRWQRIADESIKQCARIKSPKIHDEINFESAVIEFRSDLNLLFYEKHCEHNLFELKREDITHPISITIIIGPEGGFSESEVSIAENHGYLLLNLGPRILRSETAAIVSISIIQHIFGDI